MIGSGDVSRICSDNGWGPVDTSKCGDVVLPVQCPGDESSLQLQWPVTNQGTIASQACPQDFTGKVYEVHHSMNQLLQ